MANEKRLIDAYALSESISGIGKNITRPRAVELVCLCLVADQPTVDAVEGLQALRKRHDVVQGQFKPKECDLR